MPDSGGVSASKGIKYEVLFGVYKLLDLLNGIISALRYQPPTTALSPLQIPNDIYVDDYSVQDKNGNKTFYQVKSNSKDSLWTIKRLITEGVLTQIIKQHGNEPKSTLVFVSDIPAQYLNNISDQAKKSLSKEDFEQILNKQMKKDVQRISDYLNIDIEKVWELLKYVDVDFLTEKVIQDRISDYANCRYSDPVKFAFVLKDVIEKSTGSVITREDLINRLIANGLIEMPVSLNTDIRTLLKQASGSLRSYKSDIIDIHIEREETQKLENWIKTSTDSPPIAFLLDTAGSGKSVILRDLLVKLEDQNIPVLAIKADILPNFTTPSMLMEQLGLPSSPESILACAAKNCTAVLIIDQLDALSLTFSRNQECLSIIFGLIGRLISIPNIKVVLSCRAFDRQFDPGLRRIDSKINFSITPLNKSQIQKVLDQLKMSWNDLTQREQQLLTNPQYLETFAVIVSEGKKRGLSRQPINTIQDLYNELWEMKILNPRVKNIATEKLQEAIYKLVDAIKQNQELKQPNSLFDNFPEERKYLESEGIFTPQSNSVMFFHQSFFDYCYARRFSSMSGSFSKEILEGDQGFFVRPQIVQVLTYLRATDRKRYHLELEALIGFNVETFSENKLRYHLKQVVFTFFGQQTNLDLREKVLGFKCFQYPVNKRLFILGAFGNSEWFDVINPKINLNQTDDESLDTEIIPFYRSVQESRTEIIYCAFYEQLGKSEKWESRVIWCLNSYKEWKNENAQKCLIWLFNNLDQPWYSLDLIFHNIGESNSDFGIKILPIILNSLKDQWLKLKKPGILDESQKSVSLDENKQYSESIIKFSEFNNYISKLLPENIYYIEGLIQNNALKYPTDLLDILLPWLFEMLPKLTWAPSSTDWLRDALFSYSIGHKSHRSKSEIIEGVRIALKQLAKKGPEKFLSYADQIEQSRYFILHYMLTEIFIEEASKYTSCILKYLLEDPIRFHIGDMASHTLYSRKLIGAIFPYLNQQEKIQLEKAVFAYYPEWENRIDTLRFRGSDQYELLWEVPDSLLTPEGVKARHQLQLKFPGYKISEGNSAELTRVRSPIPTEKIPFVSDDGWLAAMHHFDDDTGWDKPRRVFLTGGVIEISRDLQNLVKTQPERFKKLLKQFDARISSHYFEAVISGMVESTIDSKSVFEICEYSYNQRPDDVLIQRAICDAVEKRLDNCTSQNIVSIILKIALNSTDPECESWQIKAENGGYYHNGDPHFDGINTARGSAVRVYMQYILREYAPLQIPIITIIEKFAQDPSSAVRSCLIEFLPYISKLDHIRSVAIFNKAVEERPELLNNEVSYNYIHSVLGHNTPDMLSHIESLSQSELDKSREVAGRLATLAYLINQNISNLYYQYIEGDSHLREGIAVVLSRNIDQQDIENICIEGLRKLMYDQDKKVRDQVGHVFEFLPPPSDKITVFIKDLLESPTLEDSSRDCMNYAEKIQFEYPEISLLIAEKIIEKFNKDIINIQKSTGLFDSDLVNLAVSIQTHSNSTDIKSRSMDLFERALDLGSYHARKILEQIDR
jgi:hypothetical protein